MRALTGQAERVRFAAKSHRCDARRDGCTGWIGRGESYTATVCDERVCQRCLPIADEGAVS